LKRDQLDAPSALNVLSKYPSFDPPPTPPCQGGEQIAHSVIRFTNSTALSLVRIRPSSWASYS
jgi:hypothetical protein